MPTETESAKTKPNIIIVRRPKKSGHGHHGGAWKVAYADFVTAMMALFIVLWLMGSDEEIKKAIASFFNNPSGPGSLMGTSAAGAGHAIEIPKTDMKKLKEKLQQALLKVPSLNDIKDHVEITITADGLRIELLESEAGVFFEQGKPLPSSSGSELLQVLAHELGQLPNDLLIEGHTDAKPYGGDGSYGNWELSTDRANAARRLMESHGLRPNQVAEVRGFADRQLRHPENADSASNRRISVIVQYQAVTPEKPDAKGVDKKDKKGDDKTGKKEPDKPDAKGSDKKDAPAKK
jgi:chemotaxis protein MotB